MRYQKPDRCFREHSSCKRRTERELGRKAKREVEEGVICFWFYLSLFFIGCFIRHLAITRMKLNTFMLHRFRSYSDKECTNGFDLLG
jgi:hypothetical protein